jgi:hypothetical protein
MSKGQTFPDATVFQDGTISTVPDYVVFPDETPQMMSDDGLVVKYERQPVFHYRSKRKTLPKATCCENSADDHDRHRARFEGLSLEAYRKQCRTMKAYAKFQQRHHRMEQEAAEKRKGRDK